MVNGKEFIVSMTSWKGRIGTIHNTISSLLRQYTKADRIVLNLALEEFENGFEDLPEQLKQLYNDNKVEIYFVADNTNTMKKLIPTLLRYRDAYVLTCDDDIIYPPTHLKRHIDHLSAIQYQTPTSCNWVFPYNASGNNGSIFTFNDIKDTYLMFADTRFVACRQDDFVYGLMVSANKKDFHYFDYRVKTADKVKGVSTAIDHDYNIQFAEQWLKEYYGISLEQLRKHDFAVLEQKKENPYILSTLYESAVVGQEKCLKSHLLELQEGKDAFYNKKSTDIKAVYTLVSRGVDNYLEQLLLSIYSLKLHNDMPIIVFVDRNTYVTLRGDREILKSLADVRVIDIPRSMNLNNVEKSRYLKTNCRHWVGGDMLFIDTDTLIVDNLKDLETLNENLYMCSENAQFTLSLPVVKTLEQLQCLNNYPYFNSGIIYCKDNEMTRQFYTRWYDTWLKTREKLHTHRDQPPLAKANDDMNFISELDKAYNKMVVFTKCIKDAKIIHYWANTKTFGAEVFADIRNSGCNVQHKHYVALFKQLRASAVRDKEIVSTNLISKNIPILQRYKPINSDIARKPIKLIKTETKLRDLSVLKERILAIKNIRNS